MRRVSAWLGTPLVLSLLATSQSLQAKEPESKLQYNFVQANYFEINPGDEIEGHGKGIAGSIPWGKRLPFYTLIQFLDPDNDYEEARDHLDEPSQYSFEAGIGVHQPIAERLDWTAAVLYHVRESGEDFDDDEDGTYDEGDNDDDGVGLQLGLRHLPIDQLEWGAELAAVDVKGTELHRSLYLQWHINSIIGVGVKLLQREDDQLQMGYLRLSF
jgi:hypothetical protein